MDTTDSSDDERRPLRNRTSKSKINNVSKTDKHSTEKKKQKQNLTTSSTKRTFKRKRNRSKTSNDSRKPRNTLVHSKLNGKYWNVVSTNRHVNKSTFKQNHLDQDDTDDFISESEDVIDKKRSISRSSSSTSSINIRTLLYSKKTFITCRSPSNSFYLCQVLQDVYNHTKQISIQWYSLIDETQITENTHFKIDYKDKLDPDTILTGIQNVIHHSDKTISLKKQDIIETNRLLKKSIKNEPISSDESIDLTKSTKKRKRVISSKAAPVRKRRRTKDIDEITEGEKEKEKRTSKKTVTISKARLFKVQSNRFLKENLALTEYQVEPFFEDNLPVPFISSQVQSKLSIRAVLLNDPVLLKSLIDDVNRVCSVHIRRDLPKSLTAIHYAITNNNIDLLRMLLEDLKQPKSNRCDFPEVTMKKQSTGQASINTLGFRTAEIMASRGAREGNNALLKDVINYSNLNEILVYALKNNCSYEIYDLLRVYSASYGVYNNIIECIQAGHRKLAVSIINNINTMIPTEFTTLHREVLAFEQEDLVVNSACDVIKKTKENSRITPIHCAAINPNAKYLKQLLTIVSEPNITDKYNRRPIHFAAACEGSEPLEYLLTLNININDVDNGGNSPLHIAVTYGRTMNVEVLLRIAKEKSESNDADNQIVYEKFGLASINQMNKSRYYPIHLAVINNHLECIKVLLNYGARIDAFTSISTEKLTPLILACQKGFLPIVTYLIKKGAKVEGRDRFKRTPLIHACMYGNAHIVSYLLRMGANSNVFDSSSNTALHYAISYGWYFCVQLLIEAGANLNCINCWQTTCLEAGFSKGHYGICDYLLTEHQADINFKTDDGLTLVMITVDINISLSSVQQLEYVVIKHKADCTCIDINGRNAFHYLALNQTVQKSNLINEKDKKNIFHMAKILFEHQCNPYQRDNKAQTPLMLALQNGNFILVDFFLNEIKFEINADISHDGKTLLHYFAINCDNDHLIQTLRNLPITNEIKKMSQMFDNQGRTPFHYCALRFNQFCRDNQHWRGDSAQKEYQSIVNMFRYCLETIECDPDLGIKSIKDQKITSSISDENITMTETVENIEETSIFYLLRNVSVNNDSLIEHPLEIFLKHTKNLNILHYKTQRTPLLEAIHLNEYKTVDRLIRQPSCDINLATSIIPNERHQTPCQLSLDILSNSYIHVFSSDPVV